MLIEFSFATGISEPEFYDNLVYKFKNIVRRADFSDQFRKIFIRWEPIGYDINVKRQTACLVVNPMTVYNFASPFRTRKPIDEPRF